MPEYIPWRADKAATSLDAFTRGYLAAAEFTSEPDDREEREQWSDAYYHPSAIAEAVKVCEEFQTTHARDLEDYPDERAGMDLWYTRCGHGVGYWEEDFGPEDDEERAAVCARLAAAARILGNVDLILGDDGSLYFE